MNLVHLVAVQIMRPVGAFNSGCRSASIAVFSW